MLYLKVYGSEKMPVSQLLFTWRPWPPLLPFVGTVLDIQGDFTELSWEKHEKVSR